MKLFEALLDLEADDLNHLGRQWWSPVVATKVAFPTSGRMVFVSEAPVGVRWDLRPVAGVASRRLLVRRLRIIIREVPMTVEIDFPDPPVLVEGGSLRAVCPREIRAGMEGESWPYVELG